MQKMKTKKCFINLPALLICLLLSTSTSWAAGAPSLGMRPLSQVFNDFILHVPLMQGEFTTSKVLGYIPSPFDRSHLKGITKTLALKTQAAIPASYDLRSLGKVTPVRDQGACGSCWSFGAMASLESGLLPSEPRNFSENNLKNTHGYDWGPCDGGNVFLSTAYLMRWSGPVNETDDPYQPNSNPSPTGLTVQKHSQNIIHLPPRTSSTDNDVIKNALMSHGALTVSYYHSDAYYNATNRAYYYNGSINSNHEVAIVGWDNNFDRNKFSPAAPGNGAFIIKNSWGTSWGENGYFYISYYDSKVGYDDLAAFSTPQTTTNYARIYSYDPLGMVGNLGYGTTTAWFANIFTAQGNDKISAISFFNSSLNSPYEVYVYKDLTNATNPRSGTLVASKAGTLAESGYLTIPLTSPALVTAGQAFSVVVKLTTPGLNYPIPAEWSITGYSSGASASSGQSFISSNGTSWSDAVSASATLNVCIKAYAASNNSISALLWRETSNGAVAAWPMQGLESSGLRDISFAPLEWSMAGTGDFTGDANPDILWRQTLTGEVGIWAMNELTNTGYQAVGVAPISWKITGVGDFTGDAKPDILWRESTTGEIGIWGMNGLTNTGYQAIGIVSPLWQIAAVADFNNDGKPDILWRDTTSGAVAIWTMDGTSHTGYFDVGTREMNFIIAGAKDFNDDGYSDILWRDTATGNIDLWYMNDVTQSGSAYIGTAPVVWQIGGLF